MIFKVGDKVKDKNGCLGVVQGVVEGVPWPYYVKFSNAPEPLDFHDNWPGFDVYGLCPLGDYEMDLVE